MSTKVCLVSWKSLQWHAAAHGRCDVPWINALVYMSATLRSAICRLCLIASHVAEHSHRYMSTQTMQLAYSRRMLCRTADCQAQLYWQPIAELQSSSSMHEVAAHCICLGSFAAHWSHARTRGWCIKQHAVWYIIKHVPKCRPLVHSRDDFLSWPIMSSIINFICNDTNAVMFQVLER